MAIIAAVQFTAWFAMWAAGFARPPLTDLYSLVAIIGLVMGLIPFSLWYVFKIHKEGEARPIARIRRDLDMRRVVAVAAAVALAPVLAGAFSALKSAIPFAVPFYLDPPLASLDRLIFGTDPWRLTHAAFGWATPVIDRFYTVWLVVMLVAFNLVLLSRPSPQKARALIAYVLMWPAVGTIGSYALSSAGPIYQDALFGGHSGLREVLQRDGAIKAVALQQKLWHAYVHRFDTLGSGISAMPSMHIAMACWLALTIRGAFPRLQWVGWMYVAMIWISSVHLGWHYVSDGVPAAVGALVVWKIAAQLSHWKQARAFATRAKEAIAVPCAEHTHS